MAESYKEELEAVTNWAMRSRRLFLTLARILNNYELVTAPLVVEWVGMGGTKKSRVILEINGKYFIAYRKELDILVHGESSQSTDVSNKQKEGKFLLAQYDETVRRLKAIASSSKDLVMFDRGINDFVMLFNIDYSKGIMSEKDCQQKMKEIQEYGGNLTDVMFVHIDDVEKTLQGRMSLGSTDFIDSFSAGSQSLAQLCEQRAMVKELYKICFVESETMKQRVKRLIEIDLSEGLQFEDIFQREVIVIDLYLVFKAWEKLTEMMIKKQGGNEVVIQQSTFLLEYALGYLRDLVAKAEMAQRVRIIVSQLMNSDLEVARLVGRRVIYNGTKKPRFRTV